MHKCGGKVALSNSFQLLNESLTSPQQMAYKYVKARLDDNGQLSLRGQGGGQATEISVGGPELPVVTMTSDDMLHQQAVFHFSSRRNYRNACQWKARIKESGLKARLPGQKAVDKLCQERTDDLFTTTIIKGNIGTEAYPKTKDIGVLHGRSCPLPACVRP